MELGQPQLYIHPSAGITAVHQHTQLQMTYFLKMCACPRIRRSRILDSPASTSLILGLQACIIMPDFVNLF